MYHTAYLSYHDFCMLHILCISVQYNHNSNKILVAFHIGLLLESGLPLFGFLHDYLSASQVVYLFRHFLVSSLSAAV